MYGKILKCLTIATIYGAALIKADSWLSNSDKTVQLKYNENGIIRQDNVCNVNFVNFGIKNDILNINVSKEVIKEGKNKGKLNLKINKLKNGNLGLNRSSSGYTFTKEEIKQYIEIKQNGNLINDFTAEANNEDYITLTIKNISDCEGITVKQKFKEPVIMATYLLYSNKKPDNINQAFDISEFGPSANNVPYDLIHWDMNSGLDAIREKCGIYIDYMDIGNAGGNHWNWYLSTDNINNKNCNNKEFFETVKNHYDDYDTMEELFGDNYEGYVIKRENEDKGHMDGILANQKYLIEIYQNGCAVQNQDQVICTISSEEKLSLKKFKEEFVSNCVNVIIDQDEEATWNVNNQGIKAKFNSYILNIVNNNRGSLPTTNDDISKINYSTYSNVARFSVNLECKDGSYVGDKCRCYACPANCTKCLNKTQCTSCIKGSTLVDGSCECNEGYKEDEEGVCTFVKKVVVTKYKYVSKPVATVRKCYVKDNY